FTTPPPPASPEPQSTASASQPQATPAPAGPASPPPTNAASSAPAPAPATPRPREMPGQVAAHPRAPRKAPQKVARVEVMRPMRVRLRLRYPAELVLDGKSLGN